MFEITEYDVLTSNKGVFTPRAVYRHVATDVLYAKVGTGFIKLKDKKATSHASIRWEEHTIGFPRRDCYGALMTP